MDIQNFTTEGSNDGARPAQEPQSESKGPEHRSNPLASIIAIAGVSFITRDEDGNYTVDR